MNFVVPGGDRHNEGFLAKKKELFSDNIFFNLSPKVTFLGYIMLVYLQASGPAFIRHQKIPPRNCAESETRAKKQFNLKVGLESYL